MTLRACAALLAVAACLVAGACARFATTSEPEARVPARPEPLPLPVLEQLAPVPVIGTDALLRTRGRDRPVTFTANDADIRRLLLLLAEAADVSIVIPPDLEGRISVQFRDVPAREALHAVLMQAGLVGSDGVARAPWPPVIFYLLPVNIDFISAEAIHARFDVSREMAEFIVGSRHK